LESDAKLIEEQQDSAEKSTPKGKSTKSPPSEAVTDTDADADADTESTSAVDENEAKSVKQSTISTQKKTSRDDASGTLFPLAFLPYVFINAHTV
jgi:hypothetical protein